MDRNIGKNVSKSVSSKYSQTLFDNAKLFTTDAFKKVSKRVVWKTAEASGGLTGNETGDKIAKVLRTLSMNNSEVVTNEHFKGMSKERYISPEGKRKTADVLRLI